MDSKNKIMGVVICYFPNQDKLINLIRILKDQVDYLMIINNGGIENQYLIKNFKFRNLEIYKFDNIGIAKALNFACEIANKKKCKFIYTFDQDSSPNFDFVKKMLFERKLIEISQKKEIGALGTSYYECRGVKAEQPTIINESYQTREVNQLSQISSLESNFLITSGMMIPLKLWDENGRFDENLFIDLVDTEWCMRIASTGVKNFITLNVSMGHELSDQRPIKLFGLTFLKYGPIRQYYYFRNSIYLIKLSHIPKTYKVKLIFGFLSRSLGVLIYRDRVIDSYKKIFRGLFHGITGKAGKAEK
jgi:rhamnosyltransferase